MVYSVEGATVSPLVELNQILLLQWRRVWVDPLSPLQLFLDSIIGSEVTSEDDSKLPAEALLFSSCEKPRRGNFVVWLDEGEIWLGFSLLIGGSLYFAEC